MAFLAYFSVLGVMAAMVFAAMTIIEPKPTPTDARSLALASSLKARAPKAESRATKPAQQTAQRTAKKQAAPADDTVLELAFVPTGEEDDLEQTLASADDMPPPLPPQRPADQIATVPEPATAGAEPELPTVVPTASSRPRRARTAPREVFRYVGMQDGIPTYIRVR